VSEIRKFPLVPVPPLSAEDHARDETRRNTDLFNWAKALLAQLGPMQAIASANTPEELRKITFDVDRAEVELAIREALHPVSGKKSAHFAHLKEGGLKRILRMCFIEAKKDRATALGRGAGRTQSAPDWTADLILDKHGAVRPVLANLTRFLRWHFSWEGVLLNDEFSARVIIRKPPPWGPEASDTPWVDNHESLTRIWFQHEGIFASLGDVGRAVQAAALYNSFHPVRDHFDSLSWDDTPRLDTWLVTYLHADDTPYARAVGPRFLISAVARIYEPGCKADHMLVLEGPQGRLKSEALRTLALKDAWFTDRLSHIGGKDVIMELAGLLLVEIAEMDALKRASSSASKGFLTRRYDRFRPPYGKHTINLLRQCVFAGTINPPVGGYLTDPTGARRFWPVLCHGMIDRAGIERDRDQLWAEAIVRFKAGAKCWLETPELEALATAEQKARFKADAWQETVEEWLGERKDTSMAEVLEDALGIAPQEVTRSAEMRVASILTNLGFTQYRPNRRDKRSRRRRYQRD
jgi:predicted P-loop ATPase